MKLDLSEVQNIGHLIGEAERILLISHRAPDGDTLGSAMGLFQAFTELGKVPEAWCIDPPADVFCFMPNIEKINVGIPPHLDYDAIFIVDAGATHLTGMNEALPQLFDQSLPVVNIDHHPTNTFYGRFNLVHPESASATAVVYCLLEALNLPISRQTATCLLTGLYTDTGSFLHSNTDAEMLRIGAKLLARGANLRSISKDIFNTTKISTMKLWGRVFKSIYKTDDGVTMAVLTQKDFEETGAEYSEITGAVDYVNAVPDSQYSVILTERDGKVKGSLRTLKSDVDVCAIAAQYGGGGHIKAAGFAVPGRLEKEIRWKVV